MVNFAFTGLLTRRHYISEILRRNHHQIRVATKRSPTLQHGVNSALRDTSRPFYITTPIYYVNGQPHLGHAYTSVLSDVIARYHRAIGNDVFFLTGTDEHGQKVEQSAANAKQAPIAFADEVSARFRDLTEKLGCSNDDFIRTTESRHKEGVIDLWKRLEANGHIYLGAYEGWYSIRDEAFYAESELVDGKAPTGAEVTWVKEESYFFRLSQWTEKLLAFYEANPDFIAPKVRRNEVVSFVSQEGGLRDLSISRTTFSWGIPVPGNDKHVIYVWLDALTNYISALGYPNEDKEGNFKRYWPADLHVVGKDIVRFHAVFWPAFLMAAGLEPPKRVFAHGWWTKDGEKMSKSLGNVLDPLDLVNTYGLDYFRYFLCTEMHFGNDGDFSHDSFCAKINHELANDFGNLIQRALVMIEKHCGGVVPSPATLTGEDVQMLQIARQTADIITQQLEEQNIKTICEAAMNLAKLGNRYIDGQAPWKLAKSGETERLHTVLYVLVETLRLTAIYLAPVIPASAERIFEMMGIPEDFQTFASTKASIPAGLVIQSPSPVFPRIETPTSTSSVVSVPPKKKSEADDQLLLHLQKKYDGFTKKQLTEAIHQVGEQLRGLKAEKASKDELRPWVAELTFLKSKAA